MDALAAEGAPPAKLRFYLLAGLFSALIYLSGFLVWLTPLPIFWSYKRGRIGAAVLSLALGLLTLLLFYGFVLPVLSSKFGSSAASPVSQSPLNLGSDSSVFFWAAYYLYYGLLALILGFLESREKSPLALFLKAAGLISGAVLLAVLWYSGTRGLAWVADLQAILGQASTEFFEQNLKNEELATQWGPLKQQIPQMIYYFVRLLPAMIFDMGIFLAWFNVIASRRLLVRELCFARLGDLTRWSLPFALVWTLIILVFALIGDLYVFHSTWLHLVVLNFLLVFALLYLFQGMAILLYYGSRLPIAPMFKFLFFGLLLVFFQPLSLLLVALGFFDSWFDFRRLTPKLQKRP